MSAEEAKRIVYMVVGLVWVAILVYSIATFAHP